MSQIKIGLQLIDDSLTIKKKILSAFRQELNILINNALPNIKGRIQSLFSQSMKNSDEYNSMLGGQLQGELGVPDSLGRMNKIIQIWTDSIKLKTNLTISGNNIKGTIYIVMIDESFADVISIPESVVITDKGQSLPWLDWLLNYGTEVIVDAYRISTNFNPRYYNSRTGLSVMIKNKSKQWRVPSQFAGSPGNNWVTRVLDVISGDVEKIIEEEMQNNIP